MVNPAPDHTTDNGVGIQDVLDYHQDAHGEPEIRVASVLRRAERLVADLAPPSANATKPTDYAPMAADAELAVFVHLWETESHLERDEIMDRRKVYRDQAAVEELVRQSMGSYYVGPREIPPNADPPRPRTRLSNISPDPLW